MTRPLFAGMGGHHSARSTTDEWLTPPAVLDALGGADSFDLDPCAPQVQPWPTARAVYTQADNGLLLPWFGRVFLNPPYSRPLLGRFMGRLAGHGRGVALIFARTDTEAFQAHVFGAADAVLWIAGRLNFHRPDGAEAANGGAPSVLVAYGAQDVDVLAYCGIEGHFTALRLPRGVLVAALDVSWTEAVVGWLQVVPQFEIRGN